MSYYPKGHRHSDNVPEFNEYDHTPYGGGYDISLTYGQPIPPSEETCYPPRSSSDDFDYDRPHYTSSAEPSAYADEALDNEYQSYSKPKSRPSRSRKSKDGDEDEKPRPSHSCPSKDEDEDEKPRRKPGMNRLSGGYGGESEHGESGIESDEPGTEAGLSRGNRKSHMDLGIAERVNMRSQVQIKDLGMGGRVKMMKNLNPSMDQVMEGKVSMRRKPQNTVLIMDERPSLMSMDQGLEGKVSMKRKPQHTTPVMDEKQTLMNMDQHIVRRRVQNTDLVMDERPTRMNMNLVDMGVNLHPVMDQGTEKRVMKRRKTQNTGQVMGKRPTLRSMDLVDMGRKQTMERKRTAGMAMEGNQLVMDVQTTRQRRAQGMGRQHLRGLVMEGLRKRTTKCPAMGGVMMMMKDMVGRNL